MLWLLRAERNICGCLCMLLCLGPILVIIGVVVLASAATDSRGHTLAKYNDAVDAWTLTYRDQFSASGIYVNVNHTAITLTTDTSVDKLNDNKSGPKTYTPLKFSVSMNKIVPAQNWGVSLTQLTYMVKNQSIGVDSFTNMNTKTVSITCNVTSTCPSVCSSQGGVWNGFQCVVSVAVNNYCMKFAQNSPGVWSEAIAPGSDYGCGVISNWDTYDTVVVPNPTSPYTFYGTFTIRSAHDPYVIASDLTGGTFNFGLTQGEKAEIGIVVIIVGGVFMLPAFLIFFCCYRHFSKKHRHHGGGYAPSGYGYGYGSTHH